ncbi:MAG: hydroxyacylglutathione hydrolase [Solirubrobacterales bacterium]|nr:hydroxyacylglutathione hydrolase [Solirubrobacterales bacterium]
MKYLATGVWRLKQFPAPSVNVYLAEDVLIDAGTRWDRGRIFAEIEGRELSLLTLTHVHPDHQGVAKDICEARGVPLACHADDVDAMEGRRPVQEAAPNNPFNRLIKRIWQGPPHEVGRALSEGDEVAGFRVIHVPGHSRGEVIYFRDSDRVAICGDVIRNMSYTTGLPGVKEPPDIFTYDPAENRRSIRKLAELGPSLILPGHGPAVTDMAAFKRFVATLPA